MVIGFLIRKIVKEVRQHKASKQAEQEYEANIAAGMEPAAARAAVPEPYKEEAEEPGGMNLDLPSDPYGARTKRWSYWALVVTGAGMVVDVSSVLMSIQPLFYLVNGPDNLYGLTYGAYDLASFFLVPLYGWVADRTHRYKAIMLSGMLINVAGNVVYGFTVLASRWWMMLLGRLISGVGGSTLGVGAAYITRTSTMAHRQAKMGRYRVTQNIGRFIGPFIGYLFLGLPSPINSSSNAIKTFNWYTLPGWVSAVAVCLLTVFFCWRFADPTPDNGHFIEEHDFDAEGVAAKDSPEREKKFKRLVASWMLLSWAVCVCAFGQMSNLFALFAGQFHGITSQSENWKTFLAAGLGSLAGGVFYARGIRHFPQAMNERYIIAVSNWILVVGYLLFIPFKGPDWIPPQALFYTGSVLMGLGNVLNLTTMETFFSKKITQYRAVVKNNVAKYMAGISMAMSLGKFVGPLIVGGVTRLATPSGQTFVCPTGWVVEPDGDVFCGAPPDTICGVTASDYYIFGCVLFRIVPMYATIVGVQFLATMWMHWVMWRHWSYDD